MGHSEVDVDFEVYYMFVESIIDFTNVFDQADIQSGDPVFIELPRDFKSDGGKCDVVIRLNKILCGQDKAVRLCYEKLRNVLLDRGLVARQVYPCLFMYKTMICVVYVDDCLS